MRQSTETMKLLNVGCGQHCHSEWCNVDLTTSANGVRKHDIRRGLPFKDDYFDGVYHSHVLEHLAPDDGKSLLAECFRVLRPGGVLRIAVPDLETIARTYLSALERAELHAPGSHADHEWMTVELVDQLVRVRSGGMMARFVSNTDMHNPRFVASRVGEGILAIREPRKAPSLRKPLLRRIAKLCRSFRSSLAGGFVFLLEGKRGYAGYKEGRFRQTGEVHRWMYDRVSIRRILTELGFVEIQQQTAHDSRIPGFGRYELDVVGGRVRKPDSLFAEAMRPCQQPAIQAA